MSQKDKGIKGVVVTKSEGQEEESAVRSLDSLLRRRPVFCKNISKESPNPKEMSPPPPAEQREAWGNQCDFFLTSLGLAVGLGNLYRFPYVAFNVRVIQQSIFLN